MKKQQAKERFFTRTQVSGKFVYRDQNGKFVSEEKAKRAKRKIYTVDSKTGKINKPSLPAVKPKKVEKNPVKKGQRTSSDVLITQIYSQSVISKVAAASKSGKRIIIQTNGNNYEFSENKIPDLIIYLNVALQKFYEILKEHISSPLLLLDFAESEKQNFIFISLDSSVLDEETVPDDFEDEFSEAKKAFSTWKAYKTKTFKQYFGN